jgi:hypothetical protein
MKLLYYTCICTLTALAIAEQAEQSESDAAPAQNIVVEQIIIQTIVHQNAKITPPPLHLFGNMLNTYLHTADDETCKKKFESLPLRAKLMYLLTSDILQYEAFLNRYTDEEWRNLWHNASRKEQEHLPKTRTEQLTLIRDAYYAYLAFDSSFIFTYQNHKAPYPSDLATYKNQFYVDRDCAIKRKCMKPIIESSKKEFIEAYMLRKRLELFNL